MSARERGIWFDGPMVRAILNTKPDAWPAEPIDPARPFKWQTRRPINPQPVGMPNQHSETGEWLDVWCEDDARRDPTIERAKPLRCPYGVPGDRLYVKEALRPSGSRIVVYEEDGCPAWRDGESVTWPWKVSALAARYMPRWAARRWIEVKRVRVERLEQISEEDAQAEGLALTSCTHPDCGPGSGTRCAADSYRGTFAVTWSKSYKDSPWGSGVWVFAYDFMVLSSPKGVTECKS